MDAVERLTPTQQWAAVVIGSLLFLYWQVLPVVLGAFAETRGFSEDALGMLASAFAGGILLATASSLLWIQRYNWTWLAKAGSVLMAFGFVTVLLSGSFALLLTGHFLASLGLGITYAIVMATLSRHGQPARGFALLFLVQVVMGVCATAFLSTQLSAAQILRVSSAAMIAVGGLCAGLSHWLPTGSRAGIEAASSLVHTIPKPSLAIVLALLAILLVFVGDAGVFIFLERIGNSQGGTELGGMMVSINLGAGAFGSLTAAVLSERFGYLWPMVIAIAVSVLSVALMANGETSTLLVVAAFINGWAWNYGAAYRMGLVSKLDESGRFAVLIPTMQTMGLTVGPLLAGMLIVAGGYDLAFLTISCLWLLALAVYVPAWLAFRREVPHAG